MKLHLIILLRGEVLTEVWECLPLEPKPDENRWRRLFQARAERDLVKSPWVVGNTHAQQEWVRKKFKQDEIPCIVIDRRFAGDGEK